MEVRLDFWWGSLSSRERALGGLPVKVGDQALWQEAMRGIAGGRSRHGIGQKTLGLTDCFK